MKYQRQSKQEALKILKRYKEDYRHYFEKCLKIRDKNGNIVPFVPNLAQMKLIRIVEDWQQRYPNPKKRPTLYVIILKARQLGFSTVTEATFFHDLVFAENMVAFVVSYDEDSAVHIADIAARFYQHLPQALKPATRPYRGKGLLFENPKYNPNRPTSKANDPGLQSKFLIETARNVYAGSSFTISRLHISELAKWPNPEETMTSLLQAVPGKNAIVIVESTANGLNYFYDLWNKAEAGENAFVTLFVPWHEHDEYRLDFVSGKEKERFAEHLDEFSREDGINYRELMKTYKLDLEQVAWYRDTLRNKVGGDVNMMRQEYPCCPEEAFISSGNPVFNNEIVLNRKKLLEQLYKKKPPLVGNIHARYTANGDPIKGTETFKQDPNGFLTIYEKPQTGVPYVIGGDIAEGGKDWSVGQVIDNTNGKQVAVWRGHVDTDLFAKEMFKLGHYYNEALISIEMNFDTHPVKELQRLRYRKQYKREVIDTANRNETQYKYGFKTTSASRPLIIGELVSVVREEPELINDITTLDEMLTFVRNDKGKPEAQEGKHDDTVLALAIAYNARSQQKTSRTTPKPDKLTGECYHYGELLMMGFSDKEIRKRISKKIKVIGLK